LPGWNNEKNEDKIKRFTQHSIILTFQLSILVEK